MNQESGRDKLEIPKSVRMPPKEETFKKLIAADLLGNLPVTDAFLTHFVNSISGTEVWATNLTMAWDNSAFLMLSGIANQSLAASLIIRSFNRVIDTVIPDPEVAKQAKKLREIIINENLNRIKNESRLR